MKVALVNNVPKIWAIGKYAYEIHKRLLKKLKIDHVYFDYDKKELRIENKGVLKRSRFFLDNKFLFLLRIKRYLPDYDLYHATNQNISFVLNGRNGKKSIFTCHDIIPYIYPKNFLEKKFRGFLYSGMKNADIIIADSKNTKADLIKFMKIPEGKIRVVYLGVDNIYKRISKERARKKLGLQINGKILMHVGEDLERKNTDRIYRAYFKAKERIKDLILIRIGKVKKKIPGVNYYYKVSEKEMVLFYNAADILLIPSIYEGFGLPVIEAFACGTAVIASKTSSLPEVVGDAGLLVNPYKTDEISDAIYRLLKEQKLYNNLVKKGLKRVKNFTWEKCANNILKIYKELK